MVASKFDGNATLSLWVHRYFTKDCFIDAVTSSCSDLFGFIASPLNWHFGGSTMVHPIFRHRYIYIYGLWFGTFFIFPYIGNFIIPTDFHSIIFQRGRAQPPCRFVDGMDDRAAAAKAGMIGRGWSVDLPREPWSFHGFSPSHGFFFRLFSDKARNPGLLFQSIEKNIDQHTVLGNSWKEATNHPSYGVMSIGKHSLDMGYFMLIFRRSSHRRKCIVFVARTSWINSDIYYHH